MVTPACPSHPRARVQFVWRHSRCRARARPEAYNGRYTGRTPMETMKRAGLLVLMLSLAAIAAATACRGQRRGPVDAPKRSEEHTSGLQSPCNLVCRLLLEK